MQLKNRINVQNRLDMESEFRHHIYKAGLTVAELQEMSPHRCFKAPQGWDWMEIGRELLQRRASVCASVCAHKRHQEEIAPRGNLVYECAIEGSWILLSSFSQNTS